MITVDLAPISRADLPKMLKWRNDWNLIQWTRQSDLLNEVEHEAWFDRQARDPSTRMYMLLAKTGGKTEQVGVCGLTSIDYRNRRAEFSLYIATAYQRNGLGRAALSVLLTHGFENLGLNLIWGETFTGNPALSMFLKLGFQPEGTRRSFYWKDGKFIDAHLVSITAEEWRNRGKPARDSDSDNPAQPDRVVGDTSPVVDITPTQRKAKPAAKSRLKAVEKRAEAKAEGDQ